MHPISPNLRKLSLSCVGVRADLLATSSSHNVDESAVVLDSLLGTSRGKLLLLLLGHLGGLVSHLTGTSQRTVNLSSASKTKHKVKGGLLLDIVVATGKSTFN